MFVNEHLNIINKISNKTNFNIFKIISLEKLKKFKFVLKTRWPQSGARHLVQPHQKQK